MAGDGVLTLVDSLVMGLSTLVAMLIFADWRLTVVALIPLPFLAWGAWRLGKRLHNEFEKSQAAFSKLNNKTQESMTGMKVLKAFGQGKADAASFDKLVDQTIQVNKAGVFCHLYRQHGLADVCRRLPVQYFGAGRCVL